VDTNRNSPTVEVAPRGRLVVDACGPTSPAVRLSVVVPTREEADSVGPLVRAIAGVLEREAIAGHEIVVVDDDSRDRTWELALAAASDVPSLRVVRRQGERGLAGAVVRGWQVARGDVLAVIDGDLQHPPEVLAELWRFMQRGVDLAVASRHVEGGGVSDWSLRRRTVSRAAQAIGLALLPSVVGRVSDPMSGYFMVRRTAIAGRELSPLGYKILIEVLARGAIETIAEAPYVFSERQQGGSKVTAKVYLDYLRHLLRLRRGAR
jgi:dolichol-phosphate mannosyltransferase